MTPEERESELRKLMETPIGGIEEYPTFAAIHKRAEELMERPVWTHEFAYPESLYHEILTGAVPSLDGIIAKPPHDKPVIVLGIGEAP